MSYGGALEVPISPPSQRVRTFWIDPHSQVSSSEVPATTATFYCGYLPKTKHKAILVRMDLKTRKHGE